MFFPLSKVLDVFVAPITWGLLLIIASLWEGRRRSRRCAQIFSVSALVCLYIFSLESVSEGLLRKLERAAPVTYKPDMIYDAVIVLGGMVSLATTEPDEPFYNDNVERLLKAYELLRQDKVRYAILSGGTLDQAHAFTESRVLADQLERWGIDRKRLIREDESRNTHENAFYAARKVREHDLKSLILLTSAFHMTRALGCFRQVHLDVDVFPVDYRAPVGRPNLGWLLPRASALDISTSVLHEYAGQLIYRWRGYSI